MNAPQETILSGLSHSFPQSYVQAESIYLVHFRVSLGLAVSELEQLSVY